MLSRISCGFLAFFLSTAFLQAAGPGPDRPNIVFAIADDWSWPFAGAYGSAVVKTPGFDRVAREGMLFSRAFCADPSCTPSRGSILCGQEPHRLEQGGNLWSQLPSKFTTYPDLLERAGYHVGLTGKGWGPGTLEGTGRTRNPAGPSYKSFDQFLKSVPEGKPFCYWFGSHDPHRPYEKGSGLKAGMDPDKVEVPAFLPDTPEIRRDILDYFFEIQRFDSQVGAILDALDKAGLAQSTLVVMTSDNGMPFPRAKANLYEAGLHMPMAVRWPGKVGPGQTSDAFVTFSDFAPTFLEAAGVAIPEPMTGKSLIPVLTGSKSSSGRDRVFAERERHADARKGGLGYPMRAVRTDKLLLVHNLRPDRWPAGDPEKGPPVSPYGDVDGSPSKQFVIDHQDGPEIAPFFQAAFAKRPEFELFDLSSDPWTLLNVSGQPEYAEEEKALRASLEAWMKESGDPLVSGDDDPFDHYEYFGTSKPKRK